MSDAQNGAGAVELYVTLNGVGVTTAKSAHVTTTSTHTGARFELALVPPADPVANANWWSQQANVAVEIFAMRQAAPGRKATPFSMVKGRVDKIEWDPDTGLLNATGRDRTADLIDLKTFAAYPNRTSSQVVALLGQQAGLMVRGTPTTTPVGRYYENNHDKLQMGQFHKATNAWDLVVELAEYEGFDAFVDGDTLYFQPQPKDTDPPFLVTFDLTGKVVPWPVSSVINPKFSRSLTLAKNIRVIVRSYNSRSKRPYIGDTGSGGAHGSPSQGKRNAGPAPEQYVRVIPGLKSDQDALTHAEALRRELSKHERLFTFSLPGEVVLTPRNIVKVVGTDTTFDQSYFISSIERTVDVDQGFWQTVSCKNQSAQNSVNVF